MTDAPVPTATVQPAPVVAPPAPAAPAPVTVEHISALHRHLDELGSWIGEHFKSLAALVQKSAPAIEAGAAAVAAAVPSLAPVAAAAEKVAGVVEGLISCVLHGPNPQPWCPTCQAAAKSPPTS